MTPLHQRQNPTVGSTFTFPNAPNPSTESGYGKWAEKIKAQPSYFDRPEGTKFGPWTRRVPDRGEEGDGSSTPSPELWKDQTRSAGCSPVHVHGAGARSRAQVISQYRKEMLDLVRGMPETAYELSLRDIVESPKITTPLQATEEEGEEEAAKRGEKKRRTKKRGKHKEKAGATAISRSRSMDVGGLTLRMFVPRIPGFLKGRKSVGSPENFSKVSPKPAPGDGEKNGSEKGVDREWWSVEFEPMSSSSGSSCSSNGGGGKRSMNRKLTGCYSFFQSR